jgi:uncharacterized damage-inducible protein DinB
MTIADVLTDAFGRVREAVHGAVDSMTTEQLAYRIDGTANSIAWLVWHLTRVQDDHVADAAGTKQAWTSDGWAERFGLPFSVQATGYGDTTEQVGAVRASAELLTGYYDAVHERTLRFVADLTDADLPRIVDEGWDPPVSLGVRLVSVIDDDLEHAGQAAFVRGILLRR